MRDDSIATVLAKPAVDVDLEVAIREDADIQGGEEISGQSGNARLGDIVGQETSRLNLRQPATQPIRT